MKRNVSLGLPVVCLRVGGTEVCLLGFIASSSKKRAIVTSDDEDELNVASSSKLAEEPEHKKAKIAVDETVEEMAQDVQDIAAQQLKDIKQAPKPVDAIETPSEDKVKVKKASFPPAPIFASTSKPKPSSSSSEKPKSKGKGKAKVDPDDEDDEETKMDEDAGLDSPEDADDGEDDDIKEEADKKEMNEAAMKLASTYAGTLNSVTKEESQWEEGKP